MIMHNKFKLFCVDEVVLQNFLKENDIIGSIRNDGVESLVTLDFSNDNQTEQDAKLKTFLERFSKHVYAETDVTLSEQLVKIATVRNLKISVAESFTGGGIASEITSVSGASKVFYEGIVAYSCEAKSKRLHIDKEIIDKYKPVSSEVVIGMANGLIGENNCDVAISTTGIAGPNSDDSNFLVGLCYIGIASKQKTNAYKHMFKGTRAEIVKIGVKTALFHAVMALRSGSFDI